MRYAVVTEDVRAVTTVSAKPAVVTFQRFIGASFTGMTPRRRPLFGNESGRGMEI
jgi:hypothetical protein